MAAGSRSMVDFRNSLRSYGEALAIMGAFASSTMIWWNKICIDAFARASVMPGFRRPMICSQEARRSVISSMPGAFCMIQGFMVMGMKSWVTEPGSMPSKPRPATPITVKLCPLRTMVRFNTDGSPAKRLCQ